MPPKSHLKAFIRSHARPTNTPDTSGWQPGAIVRYCRACRGRREPHLEGCPNVDVCKELRMQPLPRQQRPVDDAAALAPPAPEDLRGGRADADGSAAHDDEEFDACKINPLVKDHRPRGLRGRGADGRAVPLRPARVSLGPQSLRPLRRRLLAVRPDAHRVAARGRRVPARPLGGSRRRRARAPRPPADGAGHDRRRRHAVACPHRLALNQRKEF